MVTTIMNIDGDISNMDFNVVLPTMIKLSANEIK